MQFSWKRKTMGSSALPPVLALAVPVHGKQAKATDKKATKVEVLRPVTNVGKEVIDAASTRHAVIRRRRSELPIPINWSEGVNLMEREAAAMRVKGKPKVNIISVLSHATDDDGDEATTHYIGEEYGSKSANKVEKVATVKNTKGMRKISKVPVLSPSTKVECEDEIDDGLTCNFSCITERRLEPHFVKENSGITSMVCAADAIRAKAKRSFTVLTANEKCKEENPSAPVSEMTALNPPVVLNFTETITKELNISHPTLITKTPIERNIATDKSNKKLKKNKKIVTMMIGDEVKSDEKNFSSCNSVIGSKNFESFVKMVNSFRYTGNLNLQEPMGCTESDVTHKPKNATFTSNFKDQGASYNVKSAENEILTETKNRRRLQQRPAFPINATGKQGAPCSLSNQAQELAAQKTKRSRNKVLNVAQDRRHRKSMTKVEKMRDLYRRVSSENNWVPPNSPYELLQEDHSFDPWRVLVICMLLNQTTGEQVKKVIKRVFLICPTAEAAAQAPLEELKTIIKSLGLQNKRVRDIREMSRQYLEDGWSYVTELHGVGKYAADAYAIFCVGNLEDVVPEDHMLVKYWEYAAQWKREHYGFAID